MLIRFGESWCVRKNIVGEGGCRVFAVLRYRFFFFFVLSRVNFISDLVDFGDGYKERI